ncbi:response regulator [Aurantimonas sp. MSK8Z-1]|uniref:response regulator n=1 Tax=Mangrovibrevibacter kandeliae TaxID=2968473 RepID=UPI00211909C0|nr:response regulator [Aurantimonas sp. MSK8Z-1]MCW4115847.1 response regulator [Aurantimonas sp. MSK8Z-1]
MTPYRLLLVEDNAADADLAIEWITGILDLEVEVETAVNLSGATEKLASRTFDGVVLDLNLPDSTGVETLDRLHDVAPELPIIVCSGLNGSVDMGEVRTFSGVVDIIFKDDDPARLMAHSIRSMLRRAAVAWKHDQFLSLVTAMPDAVVVWDREGLVQFVNPAAQALFGRKAEEFEGELMSFAVEEGSSSDVEILRRGERRTAELRVTDCIWNRRPAFLAMMHDTTEEKRLAEQLRQTQKMEALGLLAGGVAHDINNLLLVMLLYADIIRKANRPDVFQTEAAEIVQAVERAQALTRQLLTFSRRQPVQMAVISIADVVTGMHSMLRRVLPANIEIATLVDENCWPVVGDSGQIEQVLMNLALNARDAMGDGGSFTIAIRNQRLSRAFGTLEPGEYLSLKVTDTGAGIPEDIQARIFEPFFTTKARGQGTGLGLATSYAIINQIGGEITVQSAVGAGTTFTILVPRASGEVARAAAPPGERADFAGSETVLVVDDDQAVARAASRILSGSGYRVVLATNGMEAQKRLEKRGEAIQLVLSDVVMPLMGGLELAEFVGRELPDLPMILMTGYSDHPITRQDGESTIKGVPVLLKPFRPQELLKMVREVLNERGSGHPGAVAAAGGP